MKSERVPAWLALSAPIALFANELAVIVSVGTVMHVLAHAIGVAFAVYVALGVARTLILARARPAACAQRRTGG